MRDEEARGDTVELQNTLTTVTDWDGPDDPDNPRNFSLRRRTCSTIAVTFLAFVSTLAASVYSPGHEQVSSAFGVSDEVALLPLSLYSCGLAFGPLAGSPMSETFGRKAVFLTTTPLFALFTLGAGFSQNIASLIICRFFAGVFASPAISCASATIVDYTAGRYRAVSLAFYYSIPFFGAVFGYVYSSGTHPGHFLTLVSGLFWVDFSLRRKTGAGRSGSRYSSLPPFIFQSCSPKRRTRRPYCNDELAG